MQFDRYTFVQLVLPDNFVPVSLEESRRLQDAHLAYVADLHEAGHLLAVGPAAGDDSHIRGFAIMTTDLETSKELWATDPGVLKNRFVAEFEEWLVPEKMIVDGPGRPPRSVAESKGLPAEPEVPGA